jgi:adenylate cyclase
MRGLVSDERETRWYIAEATVMRLPQRLTIRFKILIVTATLLLIFALTNFFSIRLSKGVVNELNTITNYFMLLSAITSKIDVDTFEFELNLRRLIQESPLEPSRLATIVTHQIELAKRLEQEFSEAAQLIDTASQDVRNEVMERVELARIAGKFSIIRRNVKPFVQLGNTVLEAIRENRSADAQRLSLGFSAFEEAFGPDLAEIRVAVNQLTRGSTVDAQRHQVHVLELSVGLFCVAALFGFGLFSILTHRLDGALRHLLHATHAVEAGQLSIELRVTSKDEIGQLAQSFNRMIIELRAKERIKDTFGKYMDPRIVSGLIGASGEHVDTAERRIITVFFSDIKSFSSLSEQLTASAMVNLLNAYFTAVTQAIRDHRGIIDKYIGDGVMAFWTPPFSPGDQHATDACLAALLQQEAIDAFRRELPQLLGLRRNVPDFKVRMGLATGEVVIGTIGSETARSYTVIGDIVNTASRLEGINKMYGTGIVVAEDTYRLAQQAVEVRELDFVTVVGKTEPVQIFELMGRAGELVPDAFALRDLFAHGLAAYRERDWDRAEEKFQECLKLAPEDGPSQLFEQRVAFLRVHPPAADWQGVWHATEK